MPATHQRKVIRDAVAAALVAAGTSAGTRVFKTQVVPWHREQLPLIGIAALSEEVELEKAAPRELRRKLDLAVVGVVEATDAVDDALDALGLEIERAMHADQWFGGVCGNSQLAGVEISIDPDGKRPVGFIKLTYEITYFSGAPDADDVALTDLTTVDTKYALANEQLPADQAEDTVNGLET